VRRSRASRSSLDASIAVGRSVVARRASSFIRRLTKDIFVDGRIAQRELEREVTRLREHAEAMTSALARDDLEASTRARAETAVRECAADIAWFETATSAAEEEAEAEEAGEEEEDAAREPTTPKKTEARDGNGGARRGTTSTSSTPDGSSGKKKKARRDGDATPIESPTRADGPHPDAFIFDLPGDGALTLEQLSAGGHAYRARSSRKDAEEDVEGDAVAADAEPAREATDDDADVEYDVGVRICGVTVRDPNVDHRLLEMGMRNLPPDGSPDRQWRLSSARIEAKRAAKTNKCANIPASYPTKAPHGLVNPELFKRLDADALFFTFYHGRDVTRTLAARELAASNWRFHKTLGCWFARLSPPDVIDEHEGFETGQVIYFDHNMRVNEADSSSSGWCQRSRSNFTSRYEDFA